LSWPISPAWLDGYRLQSLRSSAARVSARACVWFTFVVLVKRASVLCEMFRHCDREKFARQLETLTNKMQVAETSLYTLPYAHASPA
jgi:hypothetical protein